MVINIKKIKWPEFIDPTTFYNARIILLKKYLVRKPFTQTRFIQTKPSLDLSENG